MKRRKRRGGRGAVGAAGVPADRCAGSPGAAASPDSAPLPEGGDFPFGLALSSTGRGSRVGPASARAGARPSISGRGYGRAWGSVVPPPPGLQGAAGSCQGGCALPGSRPGTARGVRSGELLAAAGSCRCQLPAGRARAVPPCAPGSASGKRMGAGIRAVVTTRLPRAVPKRHGNATGKCRGQGGLFICEHLNVCGQHGGTHTFISMYILLSILG